MTRGWYSLRTVPPAVSPVSVSDLVAGVRDRKRGVATFRDDVAALLGAEHVATYGSVRQAICACLLEVQRADDRGRSTVVVPAFSSRDFAAAIEDVGLTVRYCDLEPETLAVDPASLDTIDGDDVLALVAVNLLGFGSRMDELVAFCRRVDCALVEVLGYSLGTAYQGRHLGQFGDCALLNFQEGKPIPVGGGMVTSNDPDLVFADAARPRPPRRPHRLVGYALLSHPHAYGGYRAVSGALTRLGALEGRPTTHLSADADVCEPPFPTMSGFQAAVGHRVFSRLDAHREHRTRAAAFYRERLADCPNVDLVRPAAGISEPQYVRYPILVRGEHRRETLQRRLLDAGIQASELYGLDVDPSRYPGSARLNRELLTLPTHPYTELTDWQRTVEVVRAVCSNGE